jgi:hypothetical protein
MNSSTDQGDNMDAALEAAEAKAEMYAESAWLRAAEAPSWDADRELEAEAMDAGLQLLRDPQAMAREWDLYHRALDGNDWQWGEVS